MGAARFSAVRTRRVATAAGCCLTLVACATSQPGAGGQAALFKAQIGDISGGVAPGPHSVWYVRRQPVAYVKMGFAVWQPERAHLRGWFARHFGRRAPRTAEPTAVAGANLGLPVPSRVQVTNVATGAVITVRIDDKAPIGDAIVRLSPDAAKGLGADPGKPLLVRMRYLAPVIAYNERPTLRYALGGGPRRAPATAQPPAATAFAAQAKPAPVPPAPLVAAPAPPARVLAAAAPPRPQPAVIRMAEVHPAAPALRPMIAAPAPKAAEARAAAGAFRVQAGAFANLDNAHRAVSRLEPAGGATIEPIKRGALVLYRVIVPGPKDPRSAERLRARVAQIGFSDARVLQPL